MKRRSLPYGEVGDDWSSQKRKEGRNLRLTSSKRDLHNIFRKAYIIVGGGGGGFFVVLKGIIRL